MQRDIKHAWFFKHPVEMVWEYLTKPDLLAQWLMVNDFEPVVGHKFMFGTKPKIKLGFDGRVYCEVLEVVPLKSLTYSWKGGPGDGKIRLDSVVTWTLTPKDNGTELLLEHKGFKGIENYLAYFFMNEGWRTKIPRQLAKLMDLAEPVTQN